MRPVQVETISSYENAHWSCQPCIESVEASKNSYSEGAITQGKEGLPTKPGGSTQGREGAIRTGSPALHGTC